MTKANWPDHLRHQIEEFFARAETKRQALLPILKAIQSWRGWVADEDLEDLETAFGLSAVESLEVLTFYSMLRRKTAARWRFQVCGGISCRIAGCTEIGICLRKKLQEIAMAGDNAAFDVEEVACLGVCSGAPVILLNEERHLYVTPEKALEMAIALTEEKEVVL